MKYLYNHVETTKHLHAWSDTLPLVRASFYFWIPGHRMQKSLEGLLQTLLYHILRTFPDLVFILCPERLHEQTKNNVPLRPWTLAESQTSFTLFRFQSSVAAKFYFNIDGLDEYSGDSWDVINILQELGSCPNIKLCVSSRPWNKFQDAFGQLEPRILRLHELTRKDIEIFAYENLMSCTTHSDFEPCLFSSMIQDIVDRAQGVFLWVHLVVRSLQDGMANDDPISLLHERLRTIPTDLEKFFELILESVEDVYQSRMAVTFLAALTTHRPLRIIHYHFLEQEMPIDGIVFPVAQWRDSKIRLAVLQTQRGLNGRFKGLLEPTSTIDISPKTTINFLHRTLRDFLSTKRMVEWLKSLAPHELNISMAISRSLTATCIFIDPHPSTDDLKTAIKLASRAVQETDETLQSFAIVDIAQSLYQLARPAHWHRGCGLNCYILRFAISVGYTGYLRYKIQHERAELGLNRILEHTVKCSMVDDKIFEPSLPEPLDLPLSSPQVHHNDGAQDLMISPWAAPVPFMIKELIHLGADSNGPVEGVSSWTTFLNEVTRTVHSPQGARYKEALKAFFEGKIKPDSKYFNWHKLLDNGCSTHVHGLLMELFLHGVNPNLSFPVFLQGLTKFSSLRLSDDENNTQNEILHEFLRWGADITKVYRDESREAWLNALPQELMSATESTWLPRGVEKLGIFLEYGLDFNTVLRGNITIWYRILGAIHQGTQYKNKGRSYHQSVHQVIVLSLRHGADPHAPGLPRILDWIQGTLCLLPAKDMLEMKQTLQAAIGEDLSQEDIRGGSTQPTHRPTSYAAAGIDVQNKRKAQHTPSPGGEYGTKKGRTR
jgi:hypothetical protein